MSYLDNQKKIAALYVAAYNRAPDMEGLEYWTNYLVDAEDPYAAYTEVAERFVAVDLFSEIYNTTESNRVFVESVYQNLFGHAGDEEGIDYWTEQLDTGVSTKGSFLVRFIDAALNYEPGANEDPDLDAEAIAHKNLLENRIDVSLFYVEELGAHTNVTTPGDVNDPAYQRSMEVIADVTADPATVAAAKELVTEWANAEDPGVEGITRFLTEGADRDVNAKDGFLEGTADNDTFIADIVQNGMGQQVNTLGTGDRLDGGKGNDTLDAQVTAGAYVGSNANMAIQARTKNIEEIVLEAVNRAAVSADGTLGDEVFVNAKDMENVSYIGSERSNADLTIQDLTSKGVSKGTAGMTIGMKYTGNADSRWDESDLNVFFDQDYLTRDGVEENAIEIRLANLYENKKENEPITSFDSISIELEGMEPSPLTVDITAAQGLKGEAAYDKIVELLNAAFAENGWNVEAKTLSPRNLIFSDDVNEYGAGQSAGVYWPILVTNNGPEEFTEVQFANNNKTQHGNRLETWIEYDPLSIDEPVSINVDLEKVGRSADGGGLIIGSMNKDADNVFNQKQNITVNNTVAGFDEFNVVVGGAQGKEDSSLAYMHSTDNTLRKVTIDSKEGSDANLAIGNSHTGGTFGTSAGNAGAFKDVQIMDASGFNGNLTLNAGLTTDIVAKYFDDASTLNGLNTVAALNNYNNTLDRGQDTLASFEYKGGSGDDVLTIAIDAANVVVGSIGSVDLSAVIADSTASIAVPYVQANGGNVFQMNIDGGAGDDTITILMDTLSASLGVGATNITINGGAGNDTINLTDDDVSANEWTYVVSFNDQFGIDTINHFTVAGTSAARELTQEVQVLDFTDWSAHQNTGTDPELEMFTIKIGNITKTFVANAANMDENAIASQVVTEINNMQNADGKQYFTATVDTANPQKVVLNTDKASTHVGNKNFEAVEVTLTKPVNSHIVSADEIIHSTTAEVFQEGGAIYFTGTKGADVLDFSSYAAKGVVWYDNGSDNAGANATYTGVTNALTAGDKAVYLIESAHQDGFYDVFTGIASTTAGAYQTGSLDLVGSIDFGSEQAFAADNFIF